MSIRTIAAAALLGTSLSWPALAAGEGPISEVTLSSGGLAEIVRHGTVAGGEIDVEIPLAQVDDILKSLVVHGPSASVRSIRLAGPQAADEAFRDAPFSASDLQSVPALLSSLQGTAVSVTSGGKTVAGKVLGVEIREGEKGAAALLSVLGDDGSINTLPLGTDASLTVADGAVSARIAKAVAAAGKGKEDGSRTVRIGMAGEGDVEISYVVPAPVWKTSYRLLVGKDGTARLQAWAVVENATGEDWKGVRLSLSSGEPVTLKQALFRRYWKDRREIPVVTGVGPAVAEDSGTVSTMGVSRNMAKMGGIAPAAPAVAMLADGAVSAEAAIAPRQLSAIADGSLGKAAESDVSSSFDIPGGQDLADGETMSVPIVDAEVKGEKVSLFRPFTGSVHPVAAVLIDNSTEVSLPRGLVTVYDEDSGYVGDASLSGIPAGESRLASFSEDRKVSVVTDTQPARTVYAVRVVDGMLHLSVRQRETTTYTVSGAADGPRTVVVEHPRRMGWKFSSSDADGETANAYRMKATLKPGERREMTATLETVADEVYGLADTQPELLLSWAGSVEGKETAEKLRRLADARRAQAAAQAAILRIDDQIQRLQADQDRVRQNIGAVPQGSDMQARYLGKLQEQEDGLAELEVQRRKADETVRGADEGVREVVRSF